MLATARVVVLADMHAAPAALARWPDAALSSSGGSTLAGCAFLGFGAGRVLNEVGHRLAGSGAEFEERAELRAGDTEIVADKGRAARPVREGARLARRHSRRRRKAGGTPKVRASASMRRIWGLAA